MLTYEDESTIRWAIDRRLSKEPGVTHLEIHVKPRLGDSPPHIRVGVHAELGHAQLIPPIKSRFDLPAQFDYSQLLNEIDEIAEAYKEARRSFFQLGGIPKGIEIDLGGKGVRGNWKQFA